MDGNGASVVVSDPPAMTTSSFLAFGIGSTPVLVVTDADPDEESLVEDIRGMNPDAGRIHLERIYGGMFVLDGRAEESMTIGDGPTCGVGHRAVEWSTAAGWLTLPPDSLPPHSSAWLVRDYSERERLWILPGLPDSSLVAALLEEDMVGPFTVRPAGPGTLRLADDYAAPGWTTLAVDRAAGFGSAMRH